MWMVGGLMARMLRVVMVPRYLLLGKSYGWWFRPEQLQRMRTTLLVGDADAFAAAAAPGPQPQHLSPR
jgi:hypothetical protein